MVQDTDKRYGYIVGGALVYAINSADAKVSFVRVKCSNEAEPPF